MTVAWRVPVAAGTTVVIFPFTNPAADPAWEWLPRGLAATVGETLRGLPEVTVVNRVDAAWVLSELGQTEVPLQELGIARAAAERLGADMAILGEWKGMAFPPKLLLTPPKLPSGEDWSWSDDDPFGSGEDGDSFGRQRSG